MKLIVVLFLLFNTSIFGQGTINFPESNIMYAGYPNKVELAFGGSKKKYLIHGENMVLRETKEPNHYEAIVDRGVSIAKIHITTAKRLDTVKTFTYQVRTLNSPVLSLGSAYDGGTISHADTILHVGYGSKINFADETFEIVEYGVSILNSTFPEIKGKGKILSKEVQDALLSIKDEDKPKTVSIIVTTKGPDGVHRKKIGTFLLD